MSKYQNDPERQKLLLSEFFGSADQMEMLFRNGAKGFWDEFSKQKKSLDPLNPDLLKQAQALRESLTAFDTSLVNFENSTGPAFLRTMAGIVNGANAILHAFDKPDGPQKYLGRNAHYGPAAAAQSNLGDSSSDYYQSLGRNSHYPTAQNNAVAKKLGDALNSALKKSQSGTDSSLSAPEYQGRNANWLLHKSAFITGDDGGFGSGGSDYLGEVILNGTKSGVLAAFRELMAGNEAGQPSASGSGFQKASYESSGDDPVSVGRAIGRLDGSTPSYHDPNSFYDAIISAEGTDRHGNPYDTSLGYTKSPMPLTRMNMAQALEWGDYIRKHTRLGELTNSSAKGAFQIVNTTQRAAMKALGIGMSELFSQENQQRMASWIAHHQGLGAWTSFELHREQLARASRAMREGADTAASSGRPAAQAGGHIRADIHVHGDAKKAVIKTRGAIEASLHRWPTMDEA